MEELEDDATAEAVATTAETLVADAIDAATNGGEEDPGGGEEDEEEYVEMDEKLSYLSPLLRLLTMTHLFISFSILVAYYQLKVSFYLTDNIIIATRWYPPFYVLKHSDIDKNIKLLPLLTQLQVPLVIFKREKEVCRNLEFEGKWIAEQPSDDDIMGHWDKIVISTKSFPDKYWDKFVKKKVISRRFQNI